MNVRNIRLLAMERLERSGSTETVRKMYVLGDWPQDLIPDLARWNVAKRDPHFVGNQSTGPKDHYYATAHGLMKPYYIDLRQNPTLHEEVPKAVLQRTLAQLYLHSRRIQTQSDAFDDLGEHATALEHWKQALAIDEIIEDIANALE